METDLSVILCIAIVKKTDIQDRTRRKAMSVESGWSRSGMEKMNPVSADATVPCLFVFAAIEAINRNLVIESTASVVF